MQKVLVSAGAVGAAALELNNNQATEVAEAAPHGVQQRRRSQAKKEEPAVLIQRSLAQHKASGQRVSTGRNAGLVTFAVIGGILLVGLVLFLGLYFGLKEDCPSDNKDAACGSQDKTVCGIAGNALEITTKQQFQDINNKCTCLPGTGLTFSAGFWKTVEDVTFENLVETKGPITISVTRAADTVQKINFKKLIRVGGDIIVEGSALAKTFTSFKANCFKKTTDAIKAANTEYLSTYEWKQLEEVDDFYFENHGKQVTNGLYKYEKIKKITGELFIEVVDDAKGATYKTCGEINTMEFVGPAVCGKGGQTLLKLKSDTTIETGNVKGGWQSLAAGKGSQGGLQFDGKTAFWTSDAAAPTGKGLNDLGINDKAGNALVWTENVPNVAGAVECT